LTANNNTTKRLTLISDGWTNIRGESIINYILVTPMGEAFFQSSEPAGQNSHTGEFLATRLVKVIEDVVPMHINAICSDSAANMQNAVARVRAKYSAIFGVNCTSHQLNLVIKDILATPELAALMQNAVALSKWFRNPHVPLEHLKAQQINICQKEIALSLPVKTRWQSNLDCVTALLKSQKAFESVVLVNAVGAVMTKASNKHQKARDAYALIKSPDFWSDLKKLREIITPFVQLIISTPDSSPDVSSRQTRWMSPTHPSPSSLPISLLARSLRSWTSSSPRERSRPQLSSTVFITLPP